MEGDDIGMTRQNDRKNLEKRLADLEKDREEMAAELDLKSNRGRLLEHRDALRFDYLETQNALLLNQQAELLTLVTTLEKKLAQLTQDN